MAARAREPPRKIFEMFFRANAHFERQFGQKSDPERAPRHIFESEGAGQSDLSDKSDLTGEPAGGELSYQGRFRWQAVPPTDRRGRPKATLTSPLYAKHIPGHPPVSTTPWPSALQNRDMTIRRRIREPEYLASFRKRSRSPIPIPQPD